MLRVLIADDQRINRMLLARCLDRTQFEVIEAENGRQALECFLKERPDVVLLDVMMPEMDGFETARAMKAHLGDDHVPIIMVTGLDDQESLSQGMAAGADDFVPKPFNRMVLESRMNAALRTRKTFLALQSKTDELRELHERSHREQVMAEKLMAGVLRSEALSNPMLKYRTKPMDVFNGDLLMAGASPGGGLRIMLGDFAGHGLAAAIGGLPLAMSFEQLCTEGLSLGAMAESANAKLRAVLPKDRFMAAILVEVKPREREIEVLNAGMPPLIVRGRGGGLRTQVEAKHVPFAVLPDPNYEESLVRLPLCPGDRIYLFSDGVTEGHDLTGEQFGSERLESLLTDPGGDEDRLFSRVLERLEAFLEGAPASDDLTLMEVYPDALDEDDAGKFYEAEGTDSVNMHLTPELLRGTNLMQMVQAILESVGPLQGRCAEAFAIVAELLNNALDHGVLSLDSELKHDSSGFLAYYEERAARLARLQQGFVHLDLQVARRTGRWQLRIEVRDSGPGFDFESLQGVSENRLHGRGIQMVRALCDDVRYHLPGNRVEAVYSWVDEGPLDPVN